MSVLRSEVRPGAYRDSIVLMRLRVALSELPGVLDAGAVMATPENLELLEAGGLLPAERPAAGPADLLVVVRTESEETAAEALRRVDDLLARRGDGAGTEYRPRSLETALRAAPAARWVLVSVPGRYAAGVARDALDRGRHVFLFSDHVPLEEEVELKRRAASAGLLLLGPDCGTAIVGGAGFGFANRVRRGRIGLVGASGTGLQAVSVHLHSLGRGVSHALGTGSRDLGPEVEGATAVRALDLLSRDPDTSVIVLVSKPPSSAVARRVLATAARSGKPVVAYFQGLRGADGTAGRVRLVGSLEEAAVAASEQVDAEGVADAGGAAPQTPGPAGGHHPESPRAARGDRREGPGSAGGCLRGLFSGGTLAIEALLAAAPRLGPLRSNVPSPAALPLERPGRSRGHTILDLGADEFTAGRPHPMIDNDLRARRLRQEAADPETGFVLLDVVLGDGAHPDPASQLAPVVADALAKRPEVGFAAIVIGTDRDPQGLDGQVARLEEAGVRVFRQVGAAVERACRRLAGDPRRAGSGSGEGSPPPGGDGHPAAVGLGADLLRVVEELPADPGGPGPAPETAPADALRPPAVVVNVGLESLAASLRDQGLEVVSVDWRPPAGGDDRLRAILDRLG